MNAVINQFISCLLDINRPLTTHEEIETKYSKIFGYIYFYKTEIILLSLIVIIFIALIIYIIIRTTKK